MRKRGYFMTREEALGLIDRCSEIMSEYLGSPCTVTKEWSGEEYWLEIRYDHGSRVFWSMTRNDVPYIVYGGYYDSLVDDISKIKNCIYDNRDIFNKLMWMYEHQRELGFVRSYMKIGDKVWKMYCTEQNEKTMASGSTDTMPK